MSESPTVHTPTLTVEIRSLPPQDGWACYEDTGRACLVCSCGTVTGFVDKAEAIRTAQDHQRTPPTPDPGKRS